MLDTCRLDGRDGRWLGLGNHLGLALLFAQQVLDHGTQRLTDALHGPALLGALVGVAKQKVTLGLIRLSNILCLFLGLAIEGRSYILALDDLQQVVADLVRGRLGRVLSLSLLVAQGHVLVGLVQAARRARAHRVDLPRLVQHCLRSRRDGWGKERVPLGRVMHVESVGLGAKERLGWLHGVYRMKTSIYSSFDWPT